MKNEEYKNISMNAMPQPTNLILYNAIATQSSRQKRLRNVHK